MSSFRSQTATLKTPLLTIERIVALLTPIFTAAGGALSTGIGSALGIPAKDFTDLFIAGATPALGAAITWLLGRQKFVKAEQDVQAMVEKAYRSVMSDQQAVPALEDIAHLFQAHQSQLLSELAAKIGASPSAVQVAEEVLKQLEQRQAKVTALAQTLGAAPPAGNVAGVAGSGAVPAS